MNRAYCDGCSRPMRDQDFGDITADAGQVHVRVVGSIPGLGHRGHVCRRCIVAALAALLAPSTTEAASSS